MNKREFYLKALAGDAYLITAWNIACFSLVAEGPEDWKKKPYPYRLVQMPNAHYFVNPENTAELIMIDDSVGGKPLLVRNELIELRVGDLINVYEFTTTTYGNVMANQLMLVRAFGKKIPFMSGRMSTKKIEALIEVRLIDRPVLTEGEPEPTQGDPLKEPIYVDEYLKFCDGAFSLVAYTQIFTPADTRKTMTAPKGLKELRERLIAENQGKLHDRTVVADIMRQLRELDAEHLKGDRGRDFLTSSKSLEIVRPRLFLMYGAETGIEEKVDVSLIERSLTEGWDISKFPEMNDTLRAGAFNRGKQTELGGEAVKDLFRASGNLKIASPDCGSTVGLPSFFKEDEASRIIGFTAIEDGGSTTKITQENVGTYLGKAIRLRSAMTCKNDHTDFCAVCLGDRLANNPTGLSMAVADYGSAFLGIYMSAAHSKGIQIARLSIKDQLM